MATATIAGTTVDVDAEGFLEDPAAWTPDMAVEIATANGIVLTDRHWQVVNFMRSRRPVSPSRSCTTCFPKAPRSWPPRSAASPSRAAASNQQGGQP
jgi:DsrC like protein